MTSNERTEHKILSGSGKILLALIGLFGIVGAYRLAKGLGPTTNLSDEFPWGIWIALDVVTGVALAAGGFAIAATVYVFRWEKYKPIVRPAILTAYLGYIMVAVGIFFDIGKPHALWHPLVFWNHHSIMFEVVWCVVLYLTVLTLEFAPSLFEGIGKKHLAGKLHGSMVLFPLVIAGISLSFFHQSSLGALFLLMPGRLDHLWWTTVLPYNFYLSAIAGGLAMVSLESYLAARFFKHKMEIEILQGLAKGTAIVLLVYLGLRVGDLAVTGNLALLDRGNLASTLFLLEVAGLGLVPMLLLFLPAVRKSTGAIIGVQLLVIAGLVMNRFNVTFLAQGGSAGDFYFPSWMEIMISVGLIATLIFLYRVAVLRLPIFSHARDGD
jgi:Ni/Fe-hydrogenase subunit HybB-like protein